MPDTTETQGGLTSLNTPDEQKSDAYSKVAPKELKIGKNMSVPAAAGASQSSASTLENLQAEFDRREAAKQGFEGFMNNLKDAQAWWSGGLAGPGEALAKRDEINNAREAERFQMLNAIAQHKAAIEQNKRIGDFMMGTGTTGTEGASGATAAPGVAGTAGAAGVPTSGTTQAPWLKDLLSLPAPLQNQARMQAATGDWNGFFTTVREATNKRGEAERINDLIERETDPNKKNALMYQYRGEQFKPQTAIGASGREYKYSANVPEGVLPPSDTPSALPARTVPVAPPVAPAANQPVVNRVAPPAATTAVAPAAPAVSPAAPAVSPAAPAAPKVVVPGVGGSGGQRMSTDQLEIAKQEELARTKGREKEFEEMGKDIAKQRIYTESAYKSAPLDLASQNKLEGLVNGRPWAFGVLAHPDVVSGVLNAVSQGGNIGNLGSLSIPGIRDIVLQSGGTADDITVANMAIREFARLQLNASKLIAGQGTVSDAERRLLAQVSGSIGDDPRTVKDMIKWGRARTLFDKDLGKAWDDFKTKNPGVSYEQFTTRSPEYKRIFSNWEKTTEQLAKGYENIGKKTTPSKGNVDTKNPWLQ